MGFLEYSNKTHSNIVPKGEFEDLIHEVFSVIAENLSRSLGPLGSSATILEGSLTEATKDGYSILKHYKFHNRYKKMIYNLIMTPCTRMNNSVGDGTTTAIALTNALFSWYRNRETSIDTMYRLPRDLTSAWDEVVDEIVKYVESKAIPIDPDDTDTIYHLASVASNGNDEVSKAIADIYSQVSAPGIKQKNSPTNKSYVEVVRGFDFPANLIADQFARNDDLTVTENNIAVMIVDHKIEEPFFNQVITNVNAVLRARGVKLVVLAPYYDNQMCDTSVAPYVILERQQMGTPNLYLSQYNIGKLKSHQLRDLAVICRCKVINQPMADSMVNNITPGNVDKIVDEIYDDINSPFYKSIGHIENVQLSCTNGSIFRPDINIDVDETYIDTLTRARKELEDIKSQIDYDKQSYAAKIYEANARVLQLEMNNFIYYIGADSALQRQILWDSVEDVIKCVRSATKYGVVPGCQLTLIDACKHVTGELSGHISEDDEEALNKLPDDVKLKLVIISIIHDAVISVYSQVLHGPDGRGMIKLVPRWQFTTKEGLESLQQEALDKGNEIIGESISRHQVFNLKTLEYDPGIITSAETDMMVLKVASELVKILISGNQCIIMDADVDESHQEEIEMYV